MKKYRFLEKIKDKYVIQNNKTLELELVDKSDYEEGKELDLVEDYDIISDITRKLLGYKDTEKLLIFETHSYRLYKIKRGVNTYIELEVKNGYYKIDRLYCYIPIKTVDYLLVNREDNENLYIESVIVPVWKGNMLRFHKQDDFGVILKLSMEYVDSSNVESMEDMFFDLGSLRDIDLNGLDTSKVKDMSRMFWGCYSLQRLDCSMLDTSSVETMERMFEHCIGLYDLNVYNFNTKKVKNMTAMFGTCPSLRNIDLSDFRIDSIDIMMKMFEDCRSLNKLNISNFDFSKTKHISEIFKGTNIKQLYIKSCNFKINDFTRILVHHKSDLLLTYLFGNVNGLKKIKVKDVETGAIVNTTYLDLMEFMLEKAKVYE